MKKLSKYSRREIILRLKALFPIISPGYWTKLSDAQMTEYFKRQITVNSLDQLKEICNKAGDYGYENGVEFGLMLNGGLRSSKTINYGGEIFYIRNHVDDSEQELNSEQIMDKEYTNIGEGIKKKALRFNCFN